MITIAQNETGYVELMILNKILDKYLCDNQ